uniref:Uncharacterized protein n=1 Tax=Anguilla anguilla TaxID=7936 RepID=A0A0E9SRI2_ANGAN
MLLRGDMDLPYGACSNCAEGGTERHGFNVFEVASPNGLLVYK